MTIQYILNSFDYLSDIPSLGEYTVFYKDNKPFYYIDCLNYSFEPTMINRLLKTFGADVVFEEIVSLDEERTKELKTYLQSVVED